jgi:hypothetical protein
MSLLTAIAVFLLLAGSITFALRRWAVVPGAPAAPAYAGPPVAPPPPVSREKLKLYTLEYERAAIRYNDIYSAIWQIFSYMSVVSGGILAFGAEHFHYTLLFFLALLPLVFWYWAVFRTHDRYGELCLERLEGIEKVLDLHHYIIFKKRKESGARFTHVKTWVHLFFVPATILCFLFGLCAGYAHLKYHTRLVLEKPTTLKVIVPSPAGTNK